MRTEPEVSILISTYDQLALTRRCLKALEATLSGKLSYEILLVDDASSDETAEYLGNLGGPHRVFLNDERKGFAANNNFAASQAKGMYLCLLNNDVFVKGDWLLPMLELLKDDEGAGMIGNVQKLHRTGRYDHMGIVFSPQGVPRHYLPVKPLPS